MFIEEICKFSAINNLRTLILKGNPEEGMNIYVDKGISFCGHLGDKEFANAIRSAKYLITRSGYCTIMDLFVLGVSGLIVPTPGQTEQEYLAEYLLGKGLFKTCKQNELERIDISNTLRIETTKKTNDLFVKAFQEFNSH